MDDTSPGGFGIGPDGVPWPVHAPVARDYGAGAIVGLGRGIGSASTLVALAGELARSLARRGMWRPDLILPRVAAAGVSTDVLPLLALPIALFHADDPEDRRAAILSLGRALGASDDTLLGALAIASAVAAGTFDLGDAEVMGVAAVLTIDAEADAMPAAHARVRAELARGVAASGLAALDDPPASGIARAVHHLVRDEDGARLEALPLSIERALAGMLVGAARGLDAWPDAAGALRDPALGPLLALLPAAPPRLDGGQ